jgi:adenylate cyclase
VNEFSVPLESIRACFAGVIPTHFATCSADGTPNVITVSLVHYVDSERVAVSRQFLRKTADNVRANIYAQLLVTDPVTFDGYQLDTEYLRTETEGGTFEAMKADLDAIASQSGMAGVFRLRGVDVHRVIACRKVGEGAEAEVHRPAEPDMLRALDEFVRRLGQSTEYGELTRTALHALEDLFDISHSILLLADDPGQRLFATASNGYDTPAAGAEVSFGVGLIGTAAQQQRPVCVSHLGRAQMMQTAIRTSLEEHGDTLPGHEIPLPGLAGAQSVAAIPMIAVGRLRGVLYLESDRPGQLGPQSERVWQILAGHLASALLTLETHPHEDEPGQESPARPAPPGAVLAITHYQADDSVFVGDRYIAKGVPGRILWKMAREYAGAGRTNFSNRELRLDEHIGLPAGADNLEARLLVLRRRLALQDCGIELERTGRGQLSLRVSGPLELSEVTASAGLRPGRPEAG